MLNKYICIIMFYSAITVFGQPSPPSSEAAANYAKGYFGNDKEEFVFMDGYLQTEDDKIFYFVRNTVTHDGQFSKGLVFTAGDEIVPWLIFNSGRIINADGTIISDYPSSHGRPFYTFDAQFSYFNGVPPNGSGMYIEYAFDKGRSVPDGFTIWWNNESKRFEIVNFLERIYGIPIQPHE